MKQPQVKVKLEMVETNPNMTQLRNLRKFLNLFSDCDVEVSAFRRVDSNMVGTDILVGSVLASFFNESFESELEAIFFVNIEPVFRKFHLNLR